MNTRQTPRLPFHAIGLAAFVCCLSLTACGGGGDAAATSTAPVKDTTTQAVAAPMFMRQADPVAEPPEDGSTVEGQPRGGQNVPIVLSINPGVAKDTPDLLAEVCIGTSPPERYPGWRNDRSGSARMHRIGSRPGRLRSEPART
jgi:hypothetical protein